LDTARKAAEKLAVKIEVVEAKSVTAVQGALVQIKESRPDAALLAADTQLLSKRMEIADFMAEQRIPRSIHLGNTQMLEACSFTEPIFLFCSNKLQIIWIGS